MFIEIKLDQSWKFWKSVKGIYTLSYFLDNNIENAGFVLASSKNSDSCRELRTYFFPRTWLSKNHTATWSIIAEDETHNFLFLRLLNKV